MEAALAPVPGDRRLFEEEEGHRWLRDVYLCRFFFLGFLTAQVPQLSGPFQL